jgi:pyridoxamine 5'-phosphate oxidase family protein
MFNAQEIAYLKSQRLARLATVSKSLQPDVAPVAFRFDGQTFSISGYDISRTFKYKNVKAGNTLVSLVIDDIVSEQPWRVRGIKIHGKAEIVEANGRLSLTIHPQRFWSWGIEGGLFKGGKPVSRKVRLMVPNS